MSIKRFIYTLTIAISCLGTVLPGSGLPLRPAAAQGIPTPISTANIDQIASIGARGLGGLRSLRWGGPLLLAHTDYSDTLFDLDQPGLPFRGLNGTIREPVQSLLRPDGTLVQIKSVLTEIEVRDGRTDALQRTIALADPTIADRVVGVTFSDDGDYAFVTYAQGTSVLWDLRSEKQLWKKPKLDARVFALLSAPPLLVLAPDPNRRDLFDALTGKAIASVTAPVGSNYTNVLVSADKSTLVAAAGFDIDVVTLKTGRVRRIKAAKDPVGSVGEYNFDLAEVAINGTGTTVAAITASGIVQIWDARTGVKLPAPPKGALIQSAIGFNKAGNRLRYGRDVDFELAEWDWVQKTETSLAPAATPIAFESDQIITVTGESVMLRGDEGGILRRYDFPGGGVTGAALSADGAWLAAYRYGMLRIYNVALGPAIHVAALESGRFYDNMGLTPVPGGQTLIKGLAYAGYLFRINAQSGEVGQSLLPTPALASLQVQNFKYDISPDGKQALLVIKKVLNQKTPGEGVVTEFYLTDMASSAPPQLIRTLSDSFDLQAVGWVGPLTVALIKQGTSAIIRVNLVDSSESAPIEIRGNSTYVFNADLTRLYFATSDNKAMTLTAWDLTKGQVISDLGVQVNSRAAGDSPQLNISRDGTRLSTRFGQTFALWDTEALKSIAVLSEDKSTARAPSRGGSFFFDASGHYVIRYKGYAEVDLPHSVTWWEAATGKLIAEVYYDARAVGSRGSAEVSVSPRGDTLTILDTGVRALVIYDARTGVEIYREAPAESTNPAADNPIAAIAYNPTGEILALMGNNSQLIFRDPSTGKALRQIDFTPLSYNRKLVFTGDGTVLIVNDGEDAYSVP